MWSLYIIVEQWREHFSNLTNRPPTVDPAGLDLIPQKAVMDDIYLPLCMRSRMQLNRPASAKHLELLAFLLKPSKSVGPETLKTSHNILTSIWEEEVIPNNLFDAITASLCRNKVSEQTLGTVMASPFCPLQGILLFG